MDDLHDKQTLGKIRAKSISRHAVAYSAAISHKINTHAVTTPKPAAPVAASGHTDFAKKSLFQTTAQACQENPSPEPKSKRGTVAMSIPKNVWTEAGATLLPRISISENAVVETRAVGSKGFPPNPLTGAATT